MHAETSLLYTPHPFDRTSLHYGVAHISLSLLTPSKKQHAGGDPDSALVVPFLNRQHHHYIRVGVIDQNNQVVELWRGRLRLDG